MFMRLGSLDFFYKMLFGMFTSLIHVFKYMFSVITLKVFLYFFFTHIYFSKKKKSKNS